MKNLYLLLVFISCTSLLAQNFDREFEDLVQAEKKSASKRMTLVTNPNTYNYDVTYHRLRLNVDPSQQFISGEVTTKYIAKEDISTVTFDLSDALEVSTVKQRGVNLTFTRSGNNELTVNLPVVQNTNVLDSLSINYSGVPTSSGFGAFSVDTHNGTPVLWTLSEPFGAMEWWPCKQDLNDKANNIDVYITAPSANVSVSNGLEQSKINNIDGTSTTHFKHNYPIPAYLIAIAVTNYQVYNQQGGLGTAESPFFPIINYMYPETASENIASVAVTPDIINFYESVFVPYPFRNEKYGHCQFGWGGGMEHTTVSFMTAGNSGGYTRSLIAHEMGHQWFGDKVTCGSWKDIWLNEGFATYLASMVIQNFDGENAFIGDKNAMITSITSNTGGAIYLTDTEATDVNRIFSSRLSYRKGAMVLNMLRFKLGDTNFFQGLRNYLNDPELAYAYAVTPDLQSHLEATSGMNLTEFFSDWVYNQGYPSYSITAHNLGNGQARITVNQTQSNSSVSFFEMPVPVRLTGSGGQQLDLVLENTTNGQQFIVNVPFTVTGVTFDPKKDIIAKNNSATLGATTFELESSIAIYPNPATTTISVEMPNSLTLKSCAIFNALGQKVKECSTKVIAVDQLSTGLYTLELTTSEGRMLKKFIKK
ncbi:MAG: T9SS type A sorting domain-containing protein [Flavobacterium sp.]|nr:T9SS type A sorting domain-containing protein [Flavobacterium sp.]